MYLSLDQKEDIIAVLKEKISGLQALYLFGSYVDGSAGKESDIDIAYLSEEHLSSVARWNMSQMLASKMQKEVDLIELRETNTIFRFQIISKGERFYGEGYDVESFETLAYSFYLRFQEERKPILDAIYADQKVLHV